MDNVQKLIFVLIKHLVNNLKYQITSDFPVLREAASLFYSSLCKGLLSSLKYKYSISFKRTNVIPLVSRIVPVIQLAFLNCYLVQYLLTLVVGLITFERRTD
jgi:hypothetical protein